MIQVKLLAYTMCSIHDICYKSERVLRESCLGLKSTPIATCLSRAWRCSGASNGGQGAALRTSLSL